MKDLSEGFGEFLSVRLISLEDRELPRSFNDRPSDTNKMDKSNNDNKLPALCNHSSLATSLEQMINVPDTSIGANFPNPSLLVNIYNCDAHHWSKNMILGVEDSMVSGINEKCFSTNFKSVKVRWFSGPTIDDMRFNLIPLLKIKPAALVLHVGTNHSPNEASFQIYNKLLNLVPSIIKIEK